MNLRKFYFTITSIVLTFLFVSGLLLINFMNTAAVSTDGQGNQKKDDFWNTILPKKDPINILVLGGDKVNQNTDTIMLVNFNPETTKANIISIPRDTKVRIEGSYEKINYAFPHGGPKLAVETVGDLLNVNINYYVYVDTKVFRNIIDLLGGIKDFEVPVNMDYDDPYQNLHIHLKKGIQDLDGSKAEQFMRFRHPNGHYSKEMKEYYDGSDLKRIEAQQKLLREFIRQKANILYLPKFKDVVEEIFNSIETNMPMSDALKMAQNIGSFNIDNVNFLGMLPGTTYDGTPWYFLHDKEKTADLMAQYFNAKRSFVYNENNSDSNSNINKDMNNDKAVTKKPAKKKSTSTTSKTSTKDVTKNNPSNTDSTVKGSTKPEP